MKKSQSAITYMLAVLSLGLGDDAFSADASSKEKIDYKDNGGYETTQHTQRTTPAGNAQSSDADVNVDVDSKGRVTKEVKTKATDDPSGLMNKRTESTDVKTKQKAHGGYEQKSDYKYTDAAGSNVSEKTKTDVDVDKKGNVTEDTTVERTVNPKGIFNSKTKTEKHIKAVNGTITEQKEETK